MSLHQVHVFISHSWSYSHHYATLADWIFGRRWRSGQAAIRFCNYSVPRDDPFAWRNKSTLREAIYGQIRRSHVIVIPTAMYAQNSEWISKEIDGAHRLTKPILAVDLRGAQRTSSVVGEAADLCVGWRAQSVVKGIWDLYYNGV